ncbi:hypothetical protein MKS83_06700 [Chryseobacterium sp. Y16C]|uniref:hypothetical protein n=1 Tax=Chryseobacterium sp. Y16C TaxID=2920939 RepID=UPI001F0BCBF6|nr:hypothetical protein [Chryseobacterium sp. Y16C]UMQ43381.1 hypothetical protein MKS83_06700 [Chryseobacterium sp. Y16C]
MDIKYAYYNTSKGYRVLGGTAVHFLKADGSLDGTEYIDKTSFQDITGIKSFNTYLGGDVGNNRLWVRSSDGSNPAMSFTKDGVDNAQLSFSGYEFQFINTNSTGYFPVKANGYTKNGSSDSYVLTGGGGHKLISDFALAGNLSGYVTLSTEQNINSQKTFLTGYDTYTPDGLFDVNAKPLRTTTPSSNRILLGYRDYGGGQYYPRIGFKNDASLTNWSFGLNGNDVTLGINNSASTDTFTFSPNGNFSINGNNVWHSENLEDYHQYGLGTVVEVGATDIDNVSKTSILGINDSTANRPSGVGYGSVWTHRKSATEFTQLATEIFSGQLFTRGKSDAYGFTPWRKQWDSVNFDPYSKVDKSGDIMTGNLTVPNLVLSSNSIYSQTLNGSQIIAALSDIMYVGNAAGLDYLVFQSKYELTHYQNGVAGVIWTAHNFNPESKANAWDNATAIGFSGGNVPTNDGSQYPYMYHSVAGGAIALATQGWVNNTFATLGSLNNKVSKSGDNMTGTLSLTNGANIRINGADSNWIQSYKETTGNVGIVAGFEYAHYSTRWKVGNKRGDSIDSLGYSFEFSNDGGANYTEKVRIQPDGNITTQSFGSANLWNYAYQQVSNKVDKSGDTMTGQLNALTISAQNATDKLIYDNIENYGSPLTINANASLGISLQANGNNMFYVGPSYSEFLNDLYITSGKVISNYNTNSNQWGRAYTHGLVDRGVAFVSNVDANNLANETGITSIETGNGSGNTNFPFYGYGNFLKMSSRSFTSEFVHQNDGNLYHRNWYLAGNPNDYPFRKIWDDINLEDYHQYGLGKLYLESLADADTYSGRNTGFYSLNVSLHAPFQYGTVLKMMRDDNEGGEIAVSTLGANLAFREYVGGAYSQWYYTWHTGNFNPAQYVTQTSLNTQLANYATLNGIQTFTNTNTFSQSPVIPNGTLGTHAVNLNQLNDKADRNGGNATDTWVNSANGLQTNPTIVGKMFNTNGQSDLRNATYGQVAGYINEYGIASGNPSDNWFYRMKFLHQNTGGYYGEIAIQMTSANGFYYKRYENGNDYSWVQVWDKENLSQATINNWNIAYGWGNHANAGYATGTWVNTNFIPKSHPVYNITQANINSWNAAASGSSHTHSNLSYLNNIDQWLGVGQAPRFNSVFLMDAFGYGQLVLGEGNIGGESGLVDISNKRFYAGRINEYLKYGSSIDGFEGLNIHFDEQLLGIGRELGNHEDKVQLAGDLSVDTIDINHNSRQLILNPVYNTDGDVRHSRNAHIYIVTRNAVTLPDKPILGQRIEIFNYSDSDIEVTHSNVGTMFKVPGFCKVTGIAANKGFRFDAEPVYTKQYDI